MYSASTICLKHINQKSENEQNHTVSWYEAQLLQVVELFLHVDEKDELRSLYSPLPSFMRLTRSQCNEIVKDHSVVFNRLGTLKYTFKNKGLSVIVSSKNEKKAVRRNKLKRRLYSIYFQQNVSIQAMLYVSKHAYSMEFNELKNLFHDLLAKTQKNTK